MTENHQNRQKYTYLVSENMFLFIEPSLNDFFPFKCLAFWLYKVESPLRINSKDKINMKCISIDKSCISILLCFLSLSVAFVSLKSPSSKFRKVCLCQAKINAYPRNQLLFTYSSVYFKLFCFASSLS